MNRPIQAIVFESPGQVALREFALPSCGPREVIAETIYSFVSPGTELRLLSGRHEAHGRFPFVPGYAWVGRIVEVGAELQGWQVGDLVTGRNPLALPGINQLWGGQASHHRCAVDGGDCVLKLPAGATPWDYVAVEVAAISWRGTSIAFPARGETAVVVGQGMIGAFAARWLQFHGARVIVTDLEAARLERARRWGLTAAIDGRAADLREQILAHCPGGADIVIEASGSAAGVRLAGELLRPTAQQADQRGYEPARLHGDAHVWPRLVLLATYAVPVEVPPHALFRSEGALVLRPGDRTVDDRRAVIERVRDGSLKVNEFAAPAVPLATAATAYARLRDQPGELASLVFQWRGAAA